MTTARQNNRCSIWVKCLCAGCKLWILIYIFLIEVPFVDSPEKESEIICRAYSSYLFGNFWK